MAVCHTALRCSTPAATNCFVVKPQALRNTLIYKVQGLDLAQNACSDA
jgi:hypothetical protein